MVSIPQVRPKGPDPDSPLARQNFAGARGAVFQNPSGTRDFYPADFNRRRYIQDAWRRVCVLHGFDEIDGPAFEHVGVFNTHSSPTFSAQAFTFIPRGGEATYALRPEFTPTLARMYAERAGTLSGPTRWFSTGNCFRAERPGAGRLREFWQWNADILGDGSPRADAEAIACCVSFLARVGLRPQDVRVKLSHRSAVVRVLTRAGVSDERVGEALDILELRGKVADAQLTRQAADTGLDLHAFDDFASAARANFAAAKFSALAAGAHGESLGALGGAGGSDLYEVTDLARELAAAGILAWCDLELGGVRGMAYYTGTVFEIHEHVVGATGGAGGAGRTIASGGRYDNLVAAFGGPPTPAVGFGMADSPLLLVLADHGLLPTEQALSSLLGVQPDAILAAAGELDAACTSLLTALRAAGIHARRARSGAEAAAVAEARELASRFTVVLLPGAQATLIDHATGTRSQIAAADLVMILLAQKQMPGGSAPARAVAISSN